MSLYQNPWDYEALFGPGLQDLAHYQALGAVAAGPVLELGCGTGRLLWPLRRAGLAVEGLDSSAAMLEACAQEGSRQGLSAPLHLADWRHFDLGRTYAAILLPFNGLQHLCAPQDLAAFFERLRAHLSPGGLFAFDVHLPQAALLARPAGERYGVDEGPLSVNQERVVAEQSSYDPLAQVLTQTWTLASPEGATRELSLALRQFFPQELEGLLRAQGFEVLERWGGFERQPLAEQSLKQVFLARKP